jgi:hypothetical protein
VNAPDKSAPMGEVRDMPAEQYHAVAAVSNSALGDIKRSPWHYANRVQREPTPAMAAGTLAHCAILEPATLAQRYAVRPAGMDGRTKEGKAWAEANAGRDIITAEQHATAEAQRAAVLAVPELAALLSSGYAETSVFWFDDVTGIYCKARPDWAHTLADGRVILLDLKTTADESPAGFARSVANFGYHRQDAHYSDGFTRATGIEVAAFVFAAVSATPPHLAVPYMLDDSAKAAGRAQRDELLARYAACLQANEWPAYGSGVQVLALPAWAN